MWWRRVLVVLRRMSVGILLGVVLTVILAALGWLLAGDWVAGRLTSYANSKFFTDSGTRLSVGRVTGSVFSDMVFERIRIEREVDGNWISAIEAERIDARYDLLGLIRGRPDFSSVRVFSPVIELSSDSTGRIILPIGNRPGEGGGEGLKSLSLRDIVVQDGIFRFSGRTAGFEARHLFANASLEIKGGGLDLQIQQASMELLDPIGRIERMSGRLLVAGRTIQGEDLSLLWEGRLVSGSFRWSPADSLAGLSFHGAFDSLDVGRLRRVLDSDLLPTSGVVSGRVSVNGTPTRFDFEADINGRYGTKAVDTLSVAGSRDQSVIDIRRMRLAMADYDIRQATGRIDLAGGGSLDLAVDFNGVQLDSVPLDAVNWIAGRASGHAAFDISGFLVAAEPVRGDIDLALDATTAFDLRLAGVSGNIHFAEGDGAQLSGIDLLLSEGGSLRLDGPIHPDGTLELDITGETDDWSQLAPVLAVPGLRGSGRAAGRILGTSERPVIDVAGRFTGVNGWGLQADSLNLARLTGPILPKPELAGRAETAGLIALGRKLDTVTLDFDWKEPRLTLLGFNAVSFDTTAAGTGWVDFDPAREAMGVTIQGGHLAMGRFDWLPDRDVTLTGEGDRYVLGPVRWSSAAGQATLSGTIDAGAGRMDMLIDEMDIDLLVLSGPEAAPELGGGRLQGRLRLNGENDNPDPSGLLRLVDFRWGPGIVDSAWAEFETNGSSVNLTRAAAHIGEGSATATGRVELPGSAWRVVNDWIGKQEVAWDRVNLADLAVVADQVDLAEWMSFQPPLETLHGRLSGNVVMNGLLSEPRLGGDVRLTDLQQAGWTLDSLALSGAISPGEARIDEMVLVHQGHSARIRGTSPIRLALHPFKVEQPDTPMDLSIDLTNANLSLLPPVQFGLSEASGDLEGSVRLTGTKSEPRIDGEIRLSDGRLRPLDREEVIEGMGARLVFEGNTARLVDFNAHQGKEGTLTGSGVMPLSTRGREISTLKFAARNFVVRQSGEYAVRFDGDFTVDLTPDGNGGLRPITRGAIEIDRVEIIREMNQTSPPSESGQTFDYEMTIDAPGRIYVVNSTVDMELSGDLLTRQQGGRFELIGTMDILRGYYMMLLRRFKIIEGRLTFNRVDAIDPDIDITAETNDAEYIITVRITGQASNPRLSFSARRPNEDGSAPLSEQQILNRLAPGSAIAQGLISPDGNESQAGIGVLAGSVQLLFSQVQHDLARSLGVDELRYDTPDASTPGDDQSYGRLSVLKSLTPDVTVSYSQELGASGNELSVEYRLGRLLFLRGEVARRQATELREEYGIDLRLWHEY